MFKSPFHSWFKRLEWWFLPISFVLLIFIYDEVRKFLIRRYPESKCVSWCSPVLWFWRARWEHPLEPIAQDTVIDVWGVLCEVLYCTVPDANLTQACVSIKCGPCKSLLRRTWYFTIVVTIIVQDFYVSHVALRVYKLCQGCMEGQRR